MFIIKILSDQADRWIDKREYKKAAWCYNEIEKLAKSAKRRMVK